MLTALVFCLHIYTTKSVCDIYSQILKIKPRIKKRYALVLSENIDKYSTRYNVESDIYTAILMQESGYKLDAINPKSNDYGISQINKHTIKAFKFDKNRLMSDLSYSIKAGAIVLSDFKRRHYKKEGSSYWSRYNTSKPSLRKKYAKKVERFLPTKGDYYVTIRN